jgi:hypothetical protein
MLGLTTKKMNNIAHINNLRVSKYAPIPKPTTHKSISSLTKSQIRVSFQLDVRLRHLQVHLQEERLLKGQSEVRLSLPNAAADIAQIGEGFDQWNSAQRVVLINH